MTQPSLFRTEPPEPIGHRLARRAADRADRAIVQWTDRARVVVLAFAGRQAGSWLTEDARAYAELQGLPAPPDKRAWGGVMTGLVKGGWIQSVGFGAAVSSHGSPKVRWVRR